MNQVGPMCVHLIGGDPPEQALRGAAGVAQPTSVGVDNDHDLVAVAQHSTEPGVLASIGLAGGSPFAHVAQMQDSVVEHDVPPLGFEPMERAVTVATAYLYRAAVTQMNCEAALLDHLGDIVRMHPFGCEHPEELIWVHAHDMFHRRTGVHHTVFGVEQHRCISTVAEHHVFERAKSLRPLEVALWASFVERRIYDCLNIASCARICVGLCPDCSRRVKLPGLRSRTLALRCCWGSVLWPMRACSSVG